MTMKPKDARTSHAMSRVKQLRTAPEERVAEMLRGLGHHYRRNVKSLPGRPDFANRRRGWVVNVHGCFWHNHDCKRGTTPSHNADQWVAKLTANKERDAKVEKALHEAGLSVLTLWECEVRDPEKTEARLKQFLTPF